GGFGRRDDRGRDERPARRRVVEEVDARVADVRETDAAVDAGHRREAAVLPRLIADAGFDGRTRPDARAADEDGARGTLGTDDADDDDGEDHDRHRELTGLAQV